MRYKDRTISSVAGMLNALKVQAKPKQLTWFRGQSRKKWKLVPGLARVPSRLKAENALIKTLHAERDAPDRYTPTRGMGMDVPHAAKANCDLIEFDRYAQSPNDGYAIKFRLRILLRDVFKKKISIDDL